MQMYNGFYAFKNEKNLSEPSIIFIQIINFLFVTLQVI
jgi:hypothetical protein